VRRFAFLGVETPGARACGWLVGQGPDVGKGGADY
jgi:hypothetical protein